ERREQMRALREFLLELRNRRLIGGELAAQTQDGRIRNRARLRLNLAELYLLFLQIDELHGGVDFSAIRRLGDYRVDDVGGERDVGGLFVGVSHIELGAQTLDQTPLAAEDVQCIAHRRR